MHTFSHAHKYRCHLIQAVSKLWKFHKSRIQGFKTKRQHMSVYMAHRLYLDECIGTEIVVEAGGIDS